MEIQKQTQTGVIVSIEEHNNLMNEVRTLKESVKKLEEQLNIKNNIQLPKITENEMKKLIKNNNLILERVKQWDLQGGNLMIKDGSSGKTILHSASYKRQLDIVQYVLDKGVGVDCLDNINSSSLLYVSCNGHIEVIDLLLERGANINHQDRYGCSALHCACSWNKLEVIKLLIQKGKELKNIDIDLKDYCKRTALDVAKFHKNQEIIDYLKSVIKERLITDYKNKLRELDRD